MNLDGSDSGLSGIVAISSSEFDVDMAVRNDGTVVVTLGTFGDSALANIPAGVSDVVQAEAGREFALALRGDGRVVRWDGVRDNGAATDLGLTGVTAISVANDHYLVSLNDGTVVARGGLVNYDPVPAGLDHVTAVATSLGANLALRSDGSVVEWGRGATAVPDGVANVAKISASKVSDELAVVLQNGTVLAWGGHYKGLTTIPDVSDAIAVASINIGGVVLHANGTVSGWRVTLYGEIVPVTYASNLTGITAVSGDQALKNGGTIVQPGGDPPVATLTAAVPTVIVGSGASAKYAVSLSAAQPSDVLIEYTVKGSAVNGVDYVMLRGTKKIAAGKTTANIKVQPLGAPGGSGKKTVKLTLEAGTGYSVGTSDPVKIKLLGGS